MNISEHVDATFAPLADPTRRAIVARLASGEASVVELAEPFAIIQPRCAASRYTLAYQAKYLTRLIG
jgi:hypothetical protein